MQNSRTGQKVYDFLKANPNKWFCDDCVEKATGVNRHVVNTIAWCFALFPKEFKRALAGCTLNCSDKDKISTQAISN